MRIAKILKADKVLTTRAYYAKQKGKVLPDNPNSWNESTIVTVLDRMDYCGHTVNFKSDSKSHKRKKRIPTTKAARQGMFSGVVFYADCGSKLHFATCKSFDSSQDYYRCARYKSNT